jgi:anti-sigma factor RsiW
MTGHVLDFARPPHQKLQELLPWFVNGTLDGDEIVLVEQHLQTCTACRTELDCLRVLQTEYVRVDSAPDAERALASLRPRLMDAVEPAAPRSRPARGRFGLPGLSPTWIKLALAAQFGVIFALGWEVLQPDRAPLEYHTLSAPGAPVHAAGSLVVVFDPGAPQREVAQILRRSHARIVDGPTASNGYVLEVARGELESALTHLRAEPAVVLAEPLGAERAR